MKPRDDREVPFTHDLGAIVRALESSLPSAASQRAQAAILTPYAVSTRYPVLRPAATQEEAREAQASAEAIVAWVEGIWRKQST
jgi:HEPN domain-containing protein